MEAGYNLTIKDLLKEDCEAKFITEINDSIIRKVGTHNIELKAKGGIYTVPVEVVDTVAPKATIVKKTLWLNDSIDPKSFFKDIIDETDVKVTLTNQVDVTKTGKVNLELLLTDDAGNQTKYETTTEIKKDTKGPKITAPSSIVVQKGDTVAYKKNVTVEDNRDGKIENYSIDTSEVNLNKIGTYKVVYSAKDSLGNQTEKIVQVRVIAYDIEEVKEEADKFANQILDEIITEKMNKTSQLKAIYDYVMNHYKYNGKHEGTIDDFYKDALTGFKTGQGDCYVVNAMARYLLETAGFETYGVDLEGTDMNHISFMANVGDGWYHYCAFKKKSGIRIYKWTDQQMVNHYGKFGITKMPDNVPDTPKS